jgi:bla regulator protein blaR1
MTALDALGWVIVHATWQAVVVAGVLAVFLRVGQASARLRYATAFGALALLVALSLVTAVVLATAGVGGAGVRVSGAGTPAPAELLFLIGTVLTPATKWVALAWLAGVAVLLVRWGGGWWLVARLTSRATRPARPAWTASLRRAAARMGVTSSIELLESRKVDTPTLIGHRRPVVLLPIPAFETLSTAEVESVLAHELAHVRRRDFVANGVHTVIEILFFFHPAVRWLSRTVRDERELCCDDVAVRATGSRVVYARALAQLEQLRSSSGARRLALGANGGTLLRRIQRLAGDTDSREREGVSSGMMLTLAVAATLAWVAVVGSLVVPATMHAQAAARSIAGQYTVRAHDPAGAFTITFERGRPTRATIDGIAVAGERLVARGDSLFLPWGEARHFAVRLKPNGFTWTPRSP